MSSYILGEGVIENKWLKLCSTEVFVCWQFFVFYPETSRFLIVHFLLFYPLQEDFFWWERQTGRGRLIKHPDGDRCRTQQCHTDKYPEQSMMGRGNSPSVQIQNILLQQRARNTAGVLISSALNYIFKKITRVDWLERTLAVLSFLVSFMKCLLHPRSLSLDHKRFILFFYCYFI